MTTETAAVRQFPRSKIFKPVEVMVGAATQRAHALNISIGGALLHCFDPVATAGPVRLVIGNSCRSARIAWVQGKRVGIQFIIPLSDAQLNAIVSDDANPLA